MALPLTYKPKSLRPPEPPPVSKATYCVHEMENSPYTRHADTLEEALDYVPLTTKDTVLTRRNSDGTSDLLYAWNHANSCWYLLSHEE